MHVSALFYYPIKSCGAVHVQEAELDDCGIRNDRRLLLTEPDGTFLTQREYPSMTQVQPQIEGDHLTLTAPGMPPLAAELTEDAVAHEIRIFRDTCQAVDQGEAVAEWFSEYLKTPCRLVAMAPQFARRVNPNYAHGPEDQVGFADAFPFLLTTEASLDDLNARMANPLPMNRFRPNIVVSGATAYAEDTWRSIRIGVVEFTVTKGCVRCVVTTTSQETGEKGEEPLATLATYRNLDGNGVIFGQNLIHLAHGTIWVGDEVVVN